ncbi:MAG: hydantoinase B/oxoprolinase family protein [Chloroflexota bacterium]
MQQRLSIDPIKFEVIRNALLEATEEMSITLRRSAYSTNIKTRADFSCALFDRELRPVAQAFAQANHLGSLVILVPNAVRAYGVEKLRPGDAILVNDPFVGGVHLNDITLISPVHHEGELVGYVASLAHHVDVGGGAPASVGAFREVYQEGVIIPPIKFVENGRIVPDIFTLVLAQIRSKHETAGDLRAQIAANNTGARRLQSLLQQMGRETMQFYIDELVAYTERRTQAELAKLPRGVFQAQGVIDYDGFTDQPVKLQSTITISDEGVHFDFTGCDKQRRAPVNSTYSMTYAACAYVLKTLVDPDVPVNAGFYQFVSMTAEEGSVVYAAPPGAIVGGWETHMRLTDVMLRALSQALPERIPAGTKGMICHSGFGGIKPDGDYFCFLETLAGGYGGRFGSDGPDAVQAHGQNTENAPIEETEVNYPVRILRYELVDDSAGPGRFRGGLGLRRDYVFEHEVSFTVLADRNRWGPSGLFGGEAGKRASYILHPNMPDEQELTSKVTLDLQPGDVISYRTCGGGGYGSPLERNPQAVLQDVREGKVSLRTARERYGVVVDDVEWRVDEGETAVLRAINRN